MKRYQPKTKKALEILCKDEKVFLGDIDTSLISDMSRLFARSRRDFSGIEHWDVSNVVNMECMFYRNFFI